MLQVPFSIFENVMIWAGGKDVNSGTFPVNRGNRKRRADPSGSPFCFAAPSLLAPHPYGEASIMDKWVFILLICMSVWLAGKLEKI
jgi:hypothetical protein